VNTTAYEQLKKKAASSTSFLRSRHCNKKVRLAGVARNSRNPEKVATGYTVDSNWRKRTEFLKGREAIVQFLTRKWAKELDYRLIKEIWAFQEDRIAFDSLTSGTTIAGNWFLSYGNENWAFEGNGLMARQIGSINDLPILEEDRKIFLASRPSSDDHPGLSELGF
jgi:nuclear transport factor 2 (NTF2) superfamily protein